MPEASIKHVQAAMSGVEQKQENEIGYIPTEGKPVVSPESEYVIFKLVNTKRKGRLYINGIDDIYNEKTQKVERARLLRGIESIWMKDQKDLPKEYVEQNLVSLQFENKVLRIPKWDTQMIEFARKCRHHIEAPNKKSGSKFEFYEWNPQRVAEEQLKLRHYKVDAMKKAMEVPLEKMKKHAIYLGVSPSDELGLPKTDDSFRNDYILKAEENPKLFMETLDSLLVEVSYLIKRALIDSKIDLGREKNKAYFSTGKFICSIPPGRKNQEVLIEFATSNTPEGKEFLEQLQMVTR